MDAASATSGTRRPIQACRDIAVLRKSASQAAADRYCLYWRSGKSNGELGQNAVGDLAGGVGEAEVAAGVAEGEPLVVQTQEMQDRGVQVVHVDDAFDGGAPHFVG